MKSCTLVWALVAVISGGLLCAADASAQKICGVYTNVIEFDSPATRDAAIASQPSFLSDKHKRTLASQDSAVAVKLTKGCGFDTLFMTIYPLWGKDWWDIPAARGLVKDALVQAKAANLRVHLGLSLFNADFCADPSRYPGASRTIQCDGTRPSWVCFFDDTLWKTYQSNVVEMAKLGGEVSGVLDGIFLDPEAYGPECYLCFCDNCVAKFNRWSGESMPAALVKPDAWLHARNLWTKYTVDWHDQEIRRHARELREAIHAVNPTLQLSSLLWDYPVAVGIGDARQQYFRMLAIGLGTTAKPSWTLPEHTYYSDGPDMTRIVAQIEQDIATAGAAGTVRVLPGIRLLRRDAASLRDRGQAIKTSTAAGYWLYELADLRDKTPIDFEGSLIDTPGKYADALAEMNRAVRGDP
jgi:hypothetical protein